MSAGNLREVPRLAVHLKIVTGTYILQSNRASFNQNEVDPTCLLCKTGAETLTHFQLHCATLESIREPVLKDIKYILRHSDIDFNNSEILLHLLTDCSAILDTETVVRSFSTSEDYVMLCTLRGTRDFLSYHEGKEKQKKKKKK